MNTMPRQSLQPSFKLAETLKEEEDQQIMKPSRKFSLFKPATMEEIPTKHNDHFDFDFLQAAPAYQPIISPRVIRRESQTSQALQIFPDAVER